MTVDVQGECLWHGHDGHRVCTGRALGLVPVVDNMVGAEARAPVGYVWSRADDLCRGLGKSCLDTEPQADTESGACNHATYDFALHGLSPVVDEMEHEQADDQEADGPP
jgi:hypothetical protein